MDARPHGTEWEERSKSLTRSKVFVPAALLAAILAAPLAGARDDAPPLPQADGNSRLGVATCAGSTCHGSAEALDASAVLQNEYLTWHRRDAHARAYETLRSERSRRIARRLGIGPAHEADTCLNCHADNVAPQRRGERFQIDDGIGCEGCHGGAGEWIETHVAEDATHGDNVARGMYPTDRPEDRARLCLSCHYSHPDTPMSHRIMAAGHPPLQFELATFSRIQPPHYAVDADYRERKTAATAARTWAVGQLVDARRVLGQLRDDIYRAGLFPELYYFDCNACHHDLGADDWVTRPAGNVGPGSVPLEDASLRMLGYLLTVLDPALGRRWRGGLERLHTATGEGAAAVRAAVEGLHGLAGDARARIEAGAWDGDAIVAVMQRIVAAGHDEGFGDRTSADQAAMALASLLTTAHTGKILPGDRLERLEAELDRIYVALEDRRRWSPWRYRDALRGFAEALP